jgi:hypothetical protein
LPTAPNQFHPLKTPPANTASSSKPKAARLLKQLNRGREIETGKPCDSPEEVFQDF